MRTTIDLPDPLFREAKTRAVEDGTTLRALITNYIEAGLRGKTAPLSANQRLRSPSPVAIRREPGAVLVRPLTNRQLNAILEEEDLEITQRVFPHSRSQA
jgi:hypothetical protein